MNVPAIEPGPGGRLRVSVSAAPGPRLQLNGSGSSQRETCPTEPLAGATCTTASTLAPLLSHAVMPIRNAVGRRRLLRSAP